MNEDTAAFLKLRVKCSALLLKERFDPSGSLWLYWPNNVQYMLKDYWMSICFKNIAPVDEAHAMYIKVPRYMWIQPYSFEAWSLELFLKLLYFLIWWALGCSVYHCLIILCFVFVGWGYNDYEIALRNLWCMIQIGPLNIWNQVTMDSRVLKYIMFLGLPKIRTVCFWIPYWSISFIIGLRTVRFVCFCNWVNGVLILKGTSGLLGREYLLAHVSGGSLGCDDVNWRWANRK